MNLFTEVYDAGSEVLKTPCLHQDWRDIEKGLKSLFQADGPVVQQAEVLETLRNQLSAAAKKSGGSLGKAKAQEMLRISLPETNGFQARVALVKQLKHFYLVAKKGNQNLWVVDHPKNYEQWSYELFQGKSQAELQNLLAKNDEVFGLGRRRMMSDALQLARKWSADTEVKLSDKSEKTMKLIRHWFHEEGASDVAVEASRVTLLDGFKKITAACNSSKVIFSDCPPDRASGDYDSTLAAVATGERLKVIYIYQAFLNKGKRTLSGKIPDLWFCALTIVHELSHMMLATKDIWYDYQGLKPCAAFPAAQTITNADSWAYFCGDVVGSLSKSAAKAAWK